MTRQVIDDNLPFYIIGIIEKKEGFRMNKPKIAVYCRVSTEEQTSGFSLDSQSEIIQEYARMKGYEIYDLYIDDGYSGKDFNRPEIQRLLRDLRQDKFDAVVAWKVDRISRSNRDVLTLIDLELKPRNKKLLISTCDIDSSTTNGYMFISLLGTFAEYERTIIIERVEMGMSKRAAKGFWCGGKILGYEVKDGKLIVNEAESAIVQNIFELRCQGMGYKAIASRLNEQGYRTKQDKQFQINTIKTILDNPTYIGKIRWGKHRQWDKKRRAGKSEHPILINGIHDAIVSQDLWKKAEEIGKQQLSKAAGISSYKGEFLLSGILRCPQCGAGTVMTKRRMRNGEGYHLYYMCQSYHSKGITACRTNLIDKHLIEEQVLKVINNLIKSKDIVDQIINRLEHDRNYDTAELNVQHAAHSKELKKLCKKKEEINQSLLNDTMQAEAYNEAMLAVNRKIEESEAVIHTLNIDIEKKTAGFDINEALIIEALQNFEMMFQQAENQEKKKLIKALIKKVEVEADRKQLKSIIFWFSEDNALPSSDTWRTVS